MAKRAEGSKHPPLPDLRFIQHADVETLLDPANSHQLKAIAHSEERYFVSSRDLQRRLELSQGLAEACQHVKEIVAKIASLRESQYQSEGYASEEGGRVLSNTSGDNFMHETRRSMSTVAISSYATSGAEDSSAESVSSRASPLTRTPTTTTSSSVLSTEQSIVTFKPFCSHQNCPICHSDQQLQLAPAAQTLPNLEWLAKIWIDRLRVLRAQWQAGGKNLEKWEGNTQSHWLGHGERGSSQRGGQQRGRGESGRQSGQGGRRGVGHGQPLPTADGLGRGGLQATRVSERMVGPQWPIPGLTLEPWQIWRPPP